MCTKSLELQWMRVVEIETNYLRQLFLEWANVDDKPAALRLALTKPIGQGTALRLLILLRDNELKKRMLRELVDAASVGHSDIDIGRDVIKTLPLKYLKENIVQQIEPIIERNINDDEMFRRFIELLCDIDEGMASKIINIAIDSANPEIQEIGREYNDQAQS